MKLQEKYKDQGFVIIASHVQNADRDKVVNFLRSNHVNYTVTSFGDVTVPDKLSGIPAAYLFDSRGNLVESGRPAAMKQRIVDLIKSEPHWLAAGRK